MQTETKETKVLKFLQEYGSITPMEALRFCGSFRLSAVIYNLKKQGHQFDTQRVRVKTRDGWAYVAEYTLIRGNK